MRTHAYGNDMIRIAAGLCILWVVLAVVAFVLVGFVWLAAILLAAAAGATLVGVLRARTAGTPGAVRMHRDIRAGS